MKLEEAIASIETCTSLDELRHRLHLIIQDYGFSAFTFIDAGQPHLDVPYYTGTHETSWERAYLQNDFVHVDPALVRVRRTNTPFNWGSLKLPPVIGRRKPGAVKIMEAARDHGFQEGLVVPFHFRDKLGAIHSSSTVFFWKDPPSWFHKLMDRHHHELHLIMIYWIQRAIDVGGREFRGATPFFRPPEHEEGIVLTDREREVMNWAARGKTIQDTAEILNLSTETVETYIKNALRKLGAANKTHGVAKCVALGLIDL
jgi:LuxR family quorum sensing-dependent transcriptional regulator